MAIKLKQYRVAAGLTQAKLAKAVGVSQPNYQRWESGAAPVPQDKLTKLAEALQVSEAALQGAHPPIRTHLYDDSASEDLSYYGEVAVHFQGGGDPLLLSISEGAFSRLHRALQFNLPFTTLEGLANQTVILRTEAISDLYFSSEAYDDYGPEHESYAHPPLQMPDPRDWEIVEAIAYDGVGLEDFSKEDIDRVSQRIMITDEQYDQLVREGKIKPEDLEAEKAGNGETTEQIFALATQLTYQLSSGKRRSVDPDDAEALYEALEPLLACAEGVGDALNTLIHLSIAGWHRSAFIHPQALDYLMVPTHRLEQGRIDSEANFLEELD